MDISTALLATLQRLEKIVVDVSDHEVRGQLEAELTELAAHMVGCAAAQRLLETENQYLVRLARRDKTTGLLTQTYFMERLDEEFRRAARYSMPLSLLVADLDEFKLVNDVRGYLVGNEVLRRVATIVRREIRDIDIASRHGGDEFALLLPHTDRARAARVAERIRSAVAVLPDHLSVSIGVAAVTPRISNGLELLAEADRAMYEAKALGRNRVTKVTSSL